MRISDWSSDVCSSDLLVDGAFEADLDPEVAADLRHDFGDLAHAANAVAPCALLAVHFAEDVVEEDIGAAGRVGAGIVADDGVEAKSRLDRLALEPAIEHRARDRKSVV